MKKNITILALVLMMLPMCAVSGRAAAETALSRLRGAYARSIARIQTQCSEDVARVKRSYPVSIDAAMNVHQKAGDLAGVIAVRNEQTRFKKTGTIPDESTPGLPPQITKLVAACHKNIADAEKRKNESILSTTKAYVSRLEDLKKALTKRGEFDEALKADSEQKRVARDGVVTAAEFALADEKAKHGEKTSTQPKTTPSGSTPANQVAKPAPAPPSGSRECSRCTGTGKAHEYCTECSGTGRCPTCKGLGTRPSGLKGSRNRMRCFVCRGGGKCKGCDGARLLQVDGACKYCNGKGHIPISTSGYVRYSGDPGRYSGAMYEMYRKGDIRDADFKEVMDDRRAFGGQVIRSVCFIRKSQPEDRYVSLSADKRSYFRLPCYGLSITKDVNPVVDAIGVNGTAVVTYGILSSGATYIYNITATRQPSK